MNIQDKTAQRQLIALIASSIDTTCKDFGFDELKTGQYRSQFLANLKIAIAFYIAMKRKGTKQND